MYFIINCQIDFLKIIYVKFKFLINLVITLQMEYTREYFINNFINKNFDDDLIDTEFINSNQYYLKFKNEYLNKTNDNMNNYILLIEKYNLLTNNYQINNNKYAYTFINENNFIDTNKQIKNLLSEQQKLLINFLDHLSLLTKTETFKMPDTHISTNINTRQNKIKRK